MVRAFIAIRCPDELKKGLSEAQKKIAPFGDMKLVEPANLHMTLKFLGDVADAKVDAVIDALKPISEKQRFVMSLHGIGVFPNPAYVRVVWAGVDEGARETEHLSREIDDRLHTLGFPRDERFHPHFTLARVRAVDKEKMNKFLATYAAGEFGSFTVSSVDLMESRLSPKGPAYSILKDFKLV
jgi:2'-5' RNA ligase